MKRSLEPLDPEVTKLIEAERARRDAAADSADRVYRRVETTLGIGGMGGAAAGAGGATTASASSAWSLGTVAKLGVGTMVAGALAGGAYWLFTEREAADATSSTGASTHLDGDSREQAPPAREREVTGDERSAPSQEANDVDAAPSASEVASPASQPKPKAAPSAASSGSSTKSESRAARLRREQYLLDAARSAIGQGAPGQALQHVNQHQREFPAGVLVQERESLRIRALIRAGREDEARALMRQFREKYPNSFLVGRDAGE